ncbi:MAG TPA: hypothetical protein ENJ28_04940 [Gammaproteobacteria bacterium]|nr:hypothetical protein [Gammaproteobacteria bacterium]
MWESILKTVAPVLGGAIGGPFGAMAGKFLAGELTGDKDASSEDVQALIESGNPEVMLKMKELDANFKTTLKELGIKEQDLAAKDRASARDMGIKTTLLPQMIISTIFTLSFMVILYTVFTQTLEMTEVQKNIMMYLLGILSAGMVQVMNFWFGSSSGSKEKDLPKL